MLENALRLCFKFLDTNLQFNVNSTPSHPPATTPSLGQLELIITLWARAEFRFDNPERKQQLQLSEVGKGNEW